MNHTNLEESLPKLQEAANSIHENNKNNRPPEEDTDAWVAARERGYINCLLTILAQGEVKSVIIERQKPLPELTEISKGNKELTEWASKLLFPYDSFSSELVIRNLEQSVGIKSWNPFQRRGNMQTVIVNEPNPPEVVVFEMERVGWCKGLRIELHKTGRAQHG
jgi:hypothetical protein